MSSFPEQAESETKPTKPLDPAAQQIATTLGETEPVPLLHIRRIVQTLGPDRALQLLDQAVTVETQGGLPWSMAVAAAPRAASSSGLFVKTRRPPSGAASGPGRRNSNRRPDPTAARPIAESPPRRSGRTSERDGWWGRGCLPRSCVPYRGEDVREGCMVHPLCWLCGHRRTPVAFATNRFYCRRCRIERDPDPTSEPELAVPHPWPRRPSA